MTCQSFVTALVGGMLGFMIFELFLRPLLDVAFMYAEARRERKRIWRMFPELHPDRRR